MLIVQSEGTNESTNESRCIPSVDLPPLLWIGGWSIDPRFHPFRPDSQLAGDRAVIPVDLSRCTSVDGFFTEVQRALLDCTLHTHAVDIAAWSLGSLLALHAAANHPTLVGRMALFGATPRFTRHRASGWTLGFSAVRLESAKRELLQDRRKVLQAFHRSMFADANAVITRSDTSGPFNPGESAWSTDALISGLDLLLSLDLRAAVGEVRTPTFLVHGAEDPICPVGAGRWLAEHLPNAALTELPGIGHAPFLQASKPIMHHVGEFLRERQQAQRQEPL